MDQVASLSAWLAEAGLSGFKEPQILAGFCERFAAAGGSLVRGLVFVDTLHPIYEGRIFRWRRDASEVVLTEYGSTDQGEEAERWRNSPFYHLLSTGESILVRRLSHETDGEFPMFATHREEGVTGMAVVVNRFAEDGVIGLMDCVYAAWSTDSPDGFTSAEVEALRRLAPHFALAIKTASLGRITETLVETYLGRDAGRRVLHGRIARGVAEEIKAVLWFSDLRDYTRISDASPPEHIIPMLNDYADVIVSAIHWQGGDVLKLIGDGVLAIFPAAQRQAACLAAITAAGKARAKVAKLNARRSSEGLPVTNFYLGLHIGHVFYGNIGSRDRLDFTVIGPAVNEVSRIASMCRSVDQSLLMSDVFVENLRDRRQDFLSVGRFALRGVSAPRELYTVDPAAWPTPTAD